MPVVGSDSGEDLPFEVPTPDPVKDTQPKVLPESYRGNTVDTRYQKLANLLTHISGSRWSVTYYSQVAGADNEPTAHAPSQHPVYQQYIRIFDMEIKVTDPLTTSQDPQSGNMLLTGSANTYPHFIPNVGDTFLADVGDGREGVFVLTEVERLTIMRETCYRIAYTMTGFSSETGSLKSDLDNKSVKTVYFRKDFLRFGQYPFLVEEEVATLEQLQDAYRNLISVYISEFFDYQSNTLLCPQTEQRTYDPFVVDALLAVLQVDDHPFVKRILRLNIGNDPITDAFTVWTCLLKMSKEYLPLANQKMWGVSNRTFHPWPVYGSVYHARITEVTYPRTYLPGQIKTVELGGRDIFESLPTPPIYDGEPSYIFSTYSDDYYVFSEAFYKEIEGDQSLLEIITLEALNGEAFDPQSLLLLCQDAQNWEPADRFYYVPVLIMLLKISIGRY